MNALELRRKLRLSPKQRRCVEFRAPPSPDGGPQIETVGILGEYGGGKSFAAALRFTMIATENPFDPGEHSGGSEPLSAIVAPTLGDLKKGSLVELLKILPDELIYRARLYGEYQDVQMINGHKILCYSAEGALNGPTLCQIWADEIQERIYDGKWTNIQRRVRDRRARRLNVQASGIAQRGHVEEIFRRPNTDTFHVELLYPEDNARNLARGYVDGSAFAASRERDADGWLTVRDAMFARFARTLHLRLPPGLEDIDADEIAAHPVSFAVDFGRRAAVVFGVPIHRAGARAPWALGDLSAPRGYAGADARQYSAGLLLLGQVMPSDADAEEMVAIVEGFLRERRWRIVRGRSAICLDPTAEPDQVRHFRRAFGVEPHQEARGMYHAEEAGIRAVDRALLDAGQDVRLYVHPELARDESGRGVVEMFGGYLFSRPKDKKLEHAADVVRYLVQHYVPLPNLAHSTDPEIERRIDSATRPLVSLKDSDL